MIQMGYGSVILWTTTRLNEQGITATPILISVEAGFDCLMGEPLKEKKGDKNKEKDKKNDKKKEIERERKIEKKDEKKQKVKQNKKEEKHHRKARLNLQWN